MILIVGLGNPEKKYLNNRHNIGHMFVDFIAPLLHCFIVKKEKLFITMKSDFAKASTDKQSNSETIILAKPLTFMNLSGIAVRKLIEKFKMKNEKLVIIHDDLDIPFGKFHIQFGVGPQLHNGLASIEQHLKTKDFYRVRIGVDNRLPDKKIPGETYSLQNFLSDEKKQLELDIFPRIFTQFKLHLKNEFKIMI